MKRVTRKEIWMHNGFSGSVRRAQLAMEAIMRSSTASDQSRRLANEAEAILDRLALSIKTRRDQVQ